MSKRYKENLKRNGIRMEKAEKKVKEIMKMIQDDDFTIDESLLIAKMLANDIKEATYYSSDTKLSEVDLEKERKPYYTSSIGS